jgi:serine/threonine protein kinase
MAHALQMGRAMRQVARTAFLDSHDDSDLATGATGGGLERRADVDDLDELDDDDIAARLPHGPVERVAEGGMAIVYRGHDVERGCPVAIKVLRCALVGHADHMAAFVAERHMVSRIAHPAVTTIHDSGVIDGVPYQVMAWCDGKTLAELVAYEPMSLRRVATIGAQLASALGAVHDAGVVHCDVKPENVIVDHAGEVRLVDFGVARLAGLGPVACDLISGTPSYMSPEQWEGHATSASDVYSLGCVLFELVTGAPPYQGTFVEVMRGHRSDAPPQIIDRRPEVRPSLATLIMSMLAKSPQDRPSTATVASRLAALASRTVPVCHARPAARTPHPPSRVAAAS